MSKRYCAPLRISNVEINLFENSKIKAFANVTFNGILVIKGFRVIEGCDHYKVSMPSIKKNNGEFVSTIYLNQQWLKDLIEDTIMDEYSKVSGEIFDCVEPQESTESEDTEDNNEYNE